MGGLGLGTSLVRVRLGVVTPLPITTPFALLLTLMRLRRRLVAGIVVVGLRYPVWSCKRTILKIRLLADELMY